MIHNGSFAHERTLAARMGAGCLEVNGSFVRAYNERA